MSNIVQKVVLFGPRCSGKLTIAGHLLYENGIQFERTKVDAQFAKTQYDILDDNKFSMVMNAATPSVATNSNSEACRIQSTNNKRYDLRCKSSAFRVTMPDIGVLVLSAPNLIQMQAPQLNGTETTMKQTSPTTILTNHLLDVVHCRNLVVVVNKMDHATAQYSQELFEKISSKVQEELSVYQEFIGDPLMVPIIPVSALTGENLFHKQHEQNSKMSWWQGMVLLEAMDRTKALDISQQPLRVQIQAIYSMPGMGAVPVGTVCSGVMKRGSHVVLMPGNIKGEVQIIEISNKEVQEARTEDLICFKLNKSVPRNLLTPTKICGADTSDEQTALLETKSFVAKISTHLRKLAVGETATITCGYFVTPCKVQDILMVENEKGQVTMNPTVVELKNLAVVRFVPMKPMYLDSMKEYPLVGVFTIAIQKQIAGSGGIIHVEKKML